MVGRGLSFGPKKHKSVAKGLKIRWSFLAGNPIIGSFSGFEERGRFSLFGFEEGELKALKPPVVKLKIENIHPRSLTARP